MKHEGKQHFSHEHMLIPIQPDDDNEEIKCDACEQLVTGPFFGCPLCQFFLHDYCFYAPRSMDHPFHPSHPLVLNAKPTNPFTCKACGSLGQAFDYSCADHQCEFHAHFYCANMPNTYSFEKEHGSHVLKLVAEPPYCKDETSGDDDDDQLRVPCYLCSDKDDQSQGWLYCCEPCKYVAHLKCLYSKYE